MKAEKEMKNIGKNDWMVRQRAGQARPLERKVKRELNCVETGYF